jgi:GNAT superfamily N-acetyltransferase
MKFYLGDGDYAQLKYSETGNSFSIDIVLVPAGHRSKGIGNLLIRHILLLADNLNKEVYVSARPIGSCSDEKLERLVTYYQRFGFEVLDRGLTTAYMVRKANGGQKCERQLD